MATYSFHRLIMDKVEIGNFYCLIGDNRILFLQKCLLNSSSHFIRLLSELLNLIGCRGNINSLIFEKNLFLKNHKYIKHMFMALVTSFVVLFYCCVSADILTKLLQLCFLIFIVVPWLYLGNSQVSVYRTIGPTLVYIIQYTKIV